MWTYKIWFFFIVSSCPNRKYPLILRFSIFKEVLISFLMNYFKFSPDKVNFLIIMSTPSRFPNIWTRSPRVIRLDHDLLAPPSTGAGSKFAYLLDPVLSCQPEPRPMILWNPLLWLYGKKVALGVSRVFLKYILNMLIFFKYFYK